MIITETEEKLFENDTTMTVSLLDEAVRASMPGTLTALCGLIAAATLIWAAADRVIYSDGVGSPGRPGFRAAALITVGAVLLFLFVLYPYLRGAAVLRRMRRAQGTRVPHHRFSFYQKEVEVVGANRATFRYPYTAIGAVRKTKRLLLLSMKNGTHIVMRQDSFHGCDTDDFFAFLKTTLPEKGSES